MALLTCLLLVYKNPKNQIKIVFTTVSSPQMAPQHLRDPVSMVNQKKSPLELRVRKCSIYYHAFPALPRCRRYVQWTRTPEGAGPQLDTINQSGATTHGWRLFADKRSGVAIDLKCFKSHLTSLGCANGSNWRGPISIIGKGNKKGQLERSWTTGNSSTTLLWCLFKRGE